MLNQILRSPTNNTFFQIIRYAISGGIAFTVDFISLYVLTEYFNIYYLKSAIVAFTFGLITTYILSIKWVFDKRYYKNKSIEFGIFCLIGIIGIGMNTLGMFTFTEYVHLHYLISKILSTIFVFIWNFFAKKILIFK